MSYPSSIDLNEAVQSPEHAFRDPELKKGSLKTTPLGLPLALSGGFALTYTVETGAKKYAVRCFHREVPDIQSRYAQISAGLKNIGSSYFVAFDFQPDGIRVRGRSFPVVKMDWVQGETLELYLNRISKDSKAVGKLRQDFQALAGFLGQHGVAHGDIQNMNVMISGGQLRLIDYDGMYVPGMPRGNGSEFGHKHFQHPGRSAKHHGPEMDRFSFIATDVSLAAVQADPTLHDRFREGGNTIIFKANDYADPYGSEVFNALLRMPSMATTAERFARICQSPIEAVPTLADFLADRGLPAEDKPAAIPQTPHVINYIGAFTVIDAADYAAALAQVGNRVELVGKVVSVFEGVGKRGKGKGKPYVFINFGNWLGQSVKLTIWSEGLTNLSARPGKSWEGRWISATGLVDPPYQGKHFGRPYENVGITVENQTQIIQLTEDEALFRLGRRSRQQKARPQPKANQHQASTSATSTTRNQQILQGMLGQSAPLSSSRSTTPSLSGSSVPKGVGAVQAPANSNNSPASSKAGSKVTTSNMGVNAGTLNAPNTSGLTANQALLQSLRASSSATAKSSPAPIQHSKTSGSSAHQSPSSTSIPSSQQKPISSTTPSPTKTPEYGTYWWMFLLGIIVFLVFVASLR